MRFRWRPFVIVYLGLVCLGLISTLIAASLVSAASKRRYDHQPAPGFLFEQRPFRFFCSDRPQPLPPGNQNFGVAGMEGFGVGSVSGISPNQAQAAYVRTRAETLKLPLAEIPALTIASEPANSVRVAGADQDFWELQFCAGGSGDSEAEARKSLDQVSMSRTGGLITLNASHPGGHGNLLAHVPKDAPVTVYTIGAVELRNLGGPVRISATGGRATILNTTGKVDAEGGIVDFAGSRGHVMLTSYSEIDIKLTGPRFLGGLTAYAQREVRVLLPRGFKSSVEVMVSRDKNLVCRADICSGMKKVKDGSGYNFKYAGSGAAASDSVWLRSDYSTVVIDNWPMRRIGGDH